MNHNSSTLSRSPYLLSLGILYLIFTIIVAILNFKGYSILNHFISELGNSVKSPFWWLFSTGLMVNGLVIILLTVKLTDRIKGGFSKAARLIGVVAGISGFILGFLPANLLLTAHLVAALALFIGGLFSVFLLGLQVFRDGERKMPRIYLIPKFALTVNCAIFLLLPKESVRVFLKDPENFNRPEIWWNPFFEWMVLFSLIFWVIAMVHYLRKYPR